MTTQTNKARWVEVFRKAGLDDAGMHRWHASFEAHWPDGHQRFLEWLELPVAEIASIRKGSRAGAAP